MARIDETDLVCSFADGELAGGQQLLRFSHPGAEKYCSGSDILRFPEPTQRRHRRDLVAKLWRNKTQLVQSFRLYHARIDRINANAIGTELQRKRGSNSVNSSFASSVYGGTCRLFALVFINLRSPACHCLNTLCLSWSFARSFGR